MKGIVFTEFSEMVEESFSPEMLDELILESDLPSGGSYTTVGTYDPAELVQMVVLLSEKTSTPVDDLVYAFGQHLAKRFTVMFPDFFKEAGDTFAFMKSLDNHIHVEVRKLYPDAELPEFDFDDSNPGCLVMEYRSSRGFAKLAHGLMEGVIAHYQEPVEVTLEPVDGYHHTRFMLQRQ